VIAAATLAPPLRPATNDLWTQTELVILAVTMASVGALPAYVAMRASVAKVMELMPVATARAALELLETRRSGIARLSIACSPRWPRRSRSSRSAHCCSSTRTYARSRRRRARTRAAVLARGVFDNGAADERGGRDAIEEARSRGFQVSLEPSSAVFGVAHDDAGYRIFADSNFNFPAFDFVIPCSSG